ncbi:MAG: pyridoxal phosphate-dependent aminotransferase [Gammaproteobacteria bacterium]|nr:pyridoxal phosphate-dependent aminotransferase [Gammaproteobacteria bacterium]MCH9743889.1 pyridoxal phosphate-dependent aminotransferase [Gammaproteobacteria bacterium]
MSNKLSDHVSRIQPSATLAINSKATELRNQGRDIINLSVGEPDFNTPDFVKEAAIAAIHDNFTRYTAVDGMPDLKQAIIQKLQRDNDLAFSNKEIIVSTGAKQVLYNLCQALLNEGDEAIIPAPYWVSYPAMVTLTGATSKVIETDIEQQFKITPEQLESAITDKTRLFFINSPSNPSGMAYTADELSALANILKQHPNIIIASDEIYEYTTRSMPQYVNLLNVCPELRDQMVVINGVSKSHAMTGWRIGYAAGPEYLIAGMKKVQSQSTSGACSISQKAAAAALQFGKDKIDFMFQAYQERHDFVYNKLKSMAAIKVIPADGTFYIFPNIRDVIEKNGLKDDIEFAALLLEKGGVALVPGTAFGSPGHIRISYATSLENLTKALEQIEKLT